MSTRTSPSEHYLVNASEAFLEVITIPADKYWYERKQHAIKGNYDVEELADDPDFDLRIDMELEDIHG